MSAFSGFVGLDDLELTGIYLEDKITYSIIGPLITLRDNFQYQKIMEDKMWLFFANILWNAALSMINKNKPKRTEISR